MAGPFGAGGRQDTCGDPGLARLCHIPVATQFAATAAPEDVIRRAVTEGTFPHFRFKIRDHLFEQCSAVAVGRVSSEILRLPTAEVNHWLFATEKPALSLPCRVAWRSQQFKHDFRPQPSAE